MALKIESRDLYAHMNDGSLDEAQVYFAYNALDSSATLLVHNALSAKLAESPHALTSYTHSRAMQGPAMSMMLRGVAVNQLVRQREFTKIKARREAAQTRLNLLANAIWGPEHYEEVVKTKEVYVPIGKRGQPLTPRFRTITTRIPRTRPLGLNPNSNPQVLAFFNIALGLPVVHEVRKTAEGTERTPTANDKALRKWAKARTKGPGIDPRDRTVPPVAFAAPFVALILAIREADKQLEVVGMRLDPDGRARTSYNVCGTENWRWSSSKNAFGRCSNLQNINGEMRRMFQADDGQWFISVDQEQAEPRTVSGLVWEVTGDDTYWKACSANDVHTSVASMTWPEFGWCEDAKENRRIADQPCREYKVMTYREVAKRLSNGSNYDGSSYGIAAQVGVPPDLVEAFQERYFFAFPAIRLWHADIRERLQRDRYIDTPLGQRRWFFGRPKDDSTAREAIAFVPQCTIGVLLNQVLYKAWRLSILPRNDPRHLPIQLLLQNHDSFSFQTPYREHSYHIDGKGCPLEYIISTVNDLFLTTPIPFVRGDERRDMPIPAEFKTGFNWADADTDPDRGKWTFDDGNPDGLIKWRGADTRRRTERATTTGADWLTEALA